ncbi:MAG TPA: 30S ribosome-binding factor RbfA [Stellaceae bacterium]|jgi:ribosome-binding factor A|nr:30S ribosome-binding factor RbfA [Stellaceae bacterium]
MTKKTGRARAGRLPTQRQLRVGEELRHVLAGILARHELRDPALHDATITVTEVRVSADLKNAAAFVMPLGGTHVPEILAALERGAGFMRSLIARELDLRYVPALRFMLDTTFDHASRIEALLHRPDIERDIVSAKARGVGDDHGGEDGDGA